MSFVDAMNGYRHLLTPEDLNKAASLCTSMKGQLQTKFLVLSDDRDPPPPPTNRGKRNHPGDDATGVPENSKRLHKSQGQGQATGQRPPSQVSAEINASAPLSNPQVSTEIHSAAPIASPSYKVVASKATRNRRRGSVPGRVTPRRLAKNGNAPLANQETGQDPDLIEVADETDTDHVMSQEGSGSDEDSEASTKTVVDWVRSFITFLKDVIICLLIPLSTIDNLSTTEETSLIGSFVGRSIDSNLLIISL